TPADIRQRQAFRLPGLDLADTSEVLLAVEPVSAWSPGRNDEPLALQEAKARMRHIGVGPLQLRDYIADREEHRSVLVDCRLRFIRIRNAHGPALQNLNL